MSDQPTRSDPTYQDKDIRVGILALCVIGVGLMILAAFLGMKALFFKYERDFLAEQHSISQMNVERELPQSTVLQVDEAADLAEYLENENAVLHTGEERATIDEAKSIILKSGLGPVKAGGSN